VGDGVAEAADDDDRLPRVTGNSAFVVDRGGGERVEAGAVVDVDSALHAVDGAAGEIVDGAAADGDRLVGLTCGGADRLDQSVAVGGHEAVDGDAVAVPAGRGAGDGAAIGDRHRAGAGGIHVEAGTRLPGNGRTLVVDDDHGVVAGDAMARAGDAAAVEV